VCNLDIRGRETWFLRNVPPAFSFPSEDEKLGF
jgi:hypothetical protein